ncbi:SEC14-like protein 2, partial [Orchesella cincta]
MSQTYLLTAVLVLVVFIIQVNNVSGVSVEKYLRMTLSQKTELDKFRERVTPLLKHNYMKQDSYLIQWLRSRNFDVNSAESMLREHLKWRAENDIDNIQNEDWTDMLSDFHSTLDTHDKTGRPIAVLNIYEWDIRKAVLQGRSKRFMRYVIRGVENITGQVYERQQKGMNVTQVVVLGSAEGFNLIQHGCPICLPLWIQFVQTIESHYPEALDELIIINATPLIKVVLETVRPILSKSNREAIKVFGVNKNQWMEYLDKKREILTSIPRTNATCEFKSGERKMALINIENEDWSDMISDFSRTMDTYDKPGAQVAPEYKFSVGVIDIYDWDIRRAVIQGKPRDYSVVVLGNANGFNIIQHGCPLCLPYWIQFIQIIENYYPEALDELIIFDAPPHNPNCAGSYQT